MYKIFRVYYIFKNSIFLFSLTSFWKSNLYAPQNE